jgi:hypothetical protein
MLCVDVLEGRTGRDALEAASTKFSPSHDWRSASWEVAEGGLRRKYGINMKGCNQVNSIGRYLEKLSKAHEINTMMRRHF